MSSTEIVALQARIRQLEVDNQSLASAAEQAAAIAEEYAADAARYRHSQNNTEQRLHDEISDASRRKDRRIQRLNTLLVEEKERNQTLHNRIEELQQLCDLSAQMESTLQASVRTLQFQLEQTAQHPSQFVADVSFLLHGLRAEHLLTPLDILEQYFPDAQAIVSDFKAYRMFIRAYSTYNLAVYLQSHIPILQHNASEALKRFIQESLRVLERLSNLMQNALHWCFENATELPQRAHKLYEAVTTLEQRTSNVFAQLLEMQQQPSLTSSQAYVTMNTDLLEMAMDVVSNIVPSSQLVQQPQSSNLCDIVRVGGDDRARNVRERLLAKTQANASSEELQSKLNVARTKLRQREGEVEDLKVRLSVYDDRLASAKEDAALIQTLKEQLSEAEQQLKRSKQREVPTEQVEHVEKAKNIAQPRNVPNDLDNADEENEHADVDRSKAGNSFLVETPLSQVHKVEETIHLRRQLLQTQLCELQDTCAESTEGDGTEWKGMKQMYDAISQALQNARVAASDASIVKLDAGTLRVRSGGVTMSRKAILQAVAYTREANAVKQWQRDRCRIEERSKMTLRVADGDLKETVSALRSKLIV